MLWTLLNPDYTPKDVLCEIEFSANVMRVPRTWNMQVLKYKLRDPAVIANENEIGAILNMDDILKELAEHKFKKYIHFNYSIYPNIL